MSSSTLEKPVYTGIHNLNVLSSMSNYNRWIYDTIKPYLGPHVLEAGCGNGNITKHIQGHAGLERYVGVDMSEEFCARLSKEIPESKKDAWSYHAMTLEDARFQQLAHPLFNSIVCLNVLEHIEDDSTTLRHFHDMLAPQGRLLLQVPAFQWLYGSLDEIDGHFRRYTKGELRDKLENAGFKAEHVFYFNLAGIPAWLWHGKILGLKTHIATEMRLWDQAVPLLRRLESLISMPAGLSVFAVAQRTK